MERQRSNDNRETGDPLVGTERPVSSQLLRRRKRSEREETGNPLVADAACGAGLSGLSRRSFNGGGSAASAKKCEMINEQ
jgi:hypothetical protein